LRSRPFVVPEDGRGSADGASGSAVLGPSSGVKMAVPVMLNETTWADGGLMLLRVAKNLDDPADDGYVDYPVDGKICPRC
jgi:hypothetical protein